MEQAERLIKKFEIFLNYDMKSDLTWRNPMDEERAKRVRKDAIELSKLCVEEMIHMAVNEKYSKGVKEILDKQLHYLIKAK